MKTYGTSGQHLTDEQFGDLLAGDPLEASASAHLLVCAHCRGEFAAVRDAMGAFHEVSFGWAQQQAPRRVPVPSRWRLRLGVRPVWNLALMTTATAVALGIGLQMPSHLRTAAPSPESSPGTPSRDELAEDNRLLSSINTELSYAPRTAVPVSQLKADAERITAHSPEPEEALAN